MTTTARAAWKKRYYDEKKKSAPKEEICTKLRHDLEQWHRRISGQLEAAKDTGKRAAGHKALEQADLRIAATRHEHEIEELHTRLQNVKLRLTTEIKVFSGRLPRRANCYRGERRTSARVGPVGLEKQYHIHFLAVAFRLSYCYDNGVCLSVRDVHCAKTV